MTSTSDYAGATSTETTRVIRRGELRILSEDLADQGDLEREQFNAGWNAAMDLASRLAAQSGHKQHAALVRRQKKEG